MHKCVSVVIIITVKQKQTQFLQESVSVSVTDESVVTRRRVEREKQRLKLIKLLNNIYDNKWNIETIPR